MIFVSNVCILGVGAGGSYLVKNAKPPFSNLFILSIAECLGLEFYCYMQHSVHTLDLMLIDGLLSWLYYSYQNTEIVLNFFVICQEML